MLGGNNGTGSCFHSKEGITQADHCSLFVLGTSIIPLVCLLKVELPLWEQPWHMNNAGAGGKSTGICQLLTKLQDNGLHFGYYPKSPA
jgi:hypothetical protein